MERYDSNKKNLKEETIHYAIYFLSRYDIETASHKSACEDLRNLSNYLLERLNLPTTSTIVRKKIDPQE